ncbi:MAG: sugar phosphate nucleotidyltransferase [Patescibacteria group bacterium]
MRSTPLQIVILAGGVGTRLWPMSRQKLPKQFQPLVGSKTLFQLAVFRAQKVTQTKNIFVATNKQFTSIVRKQAPKVPVKNIISEPAFRDTATCLGFAATILEKRNPGGIMAVIYADHLIRDEKELTRKIHAAAEVARKGKLAIIEVESYFPATQLGWVELAREVPKVNRERVFELRRFVEKPNLAKAKKFHRSKKFFWNTGLYVWRTDVLLSKFQAHLPRTFERLMRISNALNESTNSNVGANSNLRLHKLIKKEYSACEKISIDFGVMEKVSPSDIAILPAKLGWSDVGTWASLKDQLSAESKNLVDGELLAVDSSGNFVKTSSQKLVALVGVKNLVVVETADALLICEKSKSGEVKKIVQNLEKKGKLL